MMAITYATQTRNTITFTTLSKASLRGHDAITPGNYAGEPRLDCGPRAFSSNVIQVSSTGSRGAGA